MVFSFLHYNIAKDTNLRFTSLFKNLRAVALCQRSLLLLMCHCVAVGDSEQNRIRRIPALCGEAFATRDAHSLSSHSAAELRGYRVVPSVVTAESGSIFRLEVDLEEGSKASRVFVRPYHSWLTSQPIDLFRRENESNRWVSPDIVLNRPSQASLPFFYENDPKSLSGIAFQGIGEMIVEEEGQPDVSFLVRPAIGMIESTNEGIDSKVLAERIKSSAHLVNIRTDRDGTAQSLRFPFSPPASMIQELYDTLGDHFDFVVLIPTAHWETSDPLDSINFVSGRYFPGDRSIGGLGIPATQNASVYGSIGRLKGIIVLDASSRGLNASNVTHEILHHWGAYLSTSLGIKRDGSHYSHQTSAGSLLGGFRWEEGERGGFLIDFNEGTNGAYRAGNIDLYLMGLLPPERFESIKVFNRSLSFQGQARGLLESNQVVSEVHIEDLIRLHGPRVPDTQLAQRHYSMLFVLETTERWATSHEMSFYDRLSQTFVGRIPEGEQVPYIGRSWNSIARFFGDEVHWTSRAILIDRDHDELPDSWERQYYGSLDAGREDDSDGDGRSSFLEFVLATNPLRADGRAPFSWKRTEARGSLIVSRWEPTVDYVLQSSSNLLEWSEEAWSVSDAVKEIPFDGKDGSPRFYRLLFR